MTPAARVEAAKTKIAQPKGRPPKAQGVTINRSVAAPLTMMKRARRALMDRKSYESDDEPDSDAEDDSVSIAPSEIETTEAE